MECRNCGECETRTDPLSWLSGAVTSVVLMILLEAIVKAFA